MQNVVATNLGDLKLSRAVKTILEQDPKVSSVYALAEAPDGTIYAGTGPQGVVLKIKDDKVSTACKLDDGTSVFSLALDGDALLIGTGGEKGRMLKLDKSSRQAPGNLLRRRRAVRLVHHPHQRRKNLRRHRPRRAAL